MGQPAGSFHLTPSGLIQLDPRARAATRHDGLFYDGTLLWQSMRLPGDVVFAAGLLLMAWVSWSSSGR